VRDRPPLPRARNVPARVGSARRGSFVEKQKVREIDRGEALLGRYPLQQVGQRHCKVGRQFREPMGPPDRGHCGDDVSDCTLANLRAVIL
jgi:hypothetical protein